MTASATPATDREVAAGCTLSIVVPVYNGAASVGELVEALSALPVPGGLEIVLVNDGSPDDSLAVCRSLLATARVPLVVVDHARNYGEHNAVMTGLRHASGRYVITMDDDLQNPPEEVLRILDHAQANDLDVVYTYYETKEHALWRNLGSRFTNWCADKLLDKPKGLYLSSFRCMSAFAAEAIGRYDGPFPYVDGLLLQVTKRIGRIQVRHLPRAVGRSNYTLRRLVRLWMNMFLNFSVMPLRVATMLGLGLGTLGGLVGIIVLIEALFNEPPAGWASLMVAVLLVSGVQLVMLGMIGEYLGRLFLTVNRKPQGIVRTVYRGGSGAEDGR
ncbi:glycosyl transferase [Allostella sp. ATCC 35155]|nr:glycosyl transferase [Stella sp. ATCC 35155]